ncbi:hypothetical protein ACFL5U_00445 [Candidatus Margulisiibacteriota bacterium]
MTTAADKLPPPKARPDATSQVVLKKQTGSQEPSKTPAPKKPPTDTSDSFAIFEQRGHLIRDEIRRGRRNPQETEALESFIAETWSPRDHEIKARQYLAQAKSQDPKERDEAYEYLGKVLKGGKIRSRTIKQINDQMTEVLTRPTEAWETRRIGLILAATGLIPERALALNLATASNATRNTEVRQEALEHLDHRLNNYVSYPPPTPQELTVLTAVCQRLLEDPSPQIRSAAAQTLKNISRRTGHENKDLINTIYDALAEAYEGETDKAVQYNMFVALTYALNGAMRVAETPERKHDVLARWSTGFKSKNPKIREYAKLELSLMETVASVTSPRKNDTRLASLQ